MHHLAVGQAPEARKALVHRVVGLEKRLLDVPAALPPIAASREEDLDVVLRCPVAGDQHIALRRAGLVDQPGGGRPQRVVEHGFVQGRQDAFEQIPSGHVHSVAICKLLDRPESVELLQLPARFHISVIIVPCAGGCRLPNGRENSPRKCQDPFGWTVWRVVSIPGQSASRQRPYVQPTRVPSVFFPKPLNFLPFGRRENPVEWVNFECVLLFCRPA